MRVWLKPSKSQKCYSIWCHVWSKTTIDRKMQWLNAQKRIESIMNQFRNVSTVRMVLNYINYMVMRRVHYGRRWHLFLPSHSMAIRADRHQYWKIYSVKCVKWWPVEVLHPMCAHSTVLTSTINIDLVDFLIFNQFIYLLIYECCDMQWKYFEKMKPNTGSLDIIQIQSSATRSGTKRISNFDFSYPQFNSNRYCILFCRHICIANGLLDSFTHFFELIYHQSSYEQLFILFYQYPLILSVHSDFSTTIAMRYKFWYYTRLRFRSIPFTNLTFVFCSFSLFPVKKAIKG